MPQPKKKRADRQLAPKASVAPVAGNDPKGRWTFLIITSVVVVFILMIFGFFYYQQYLAPFRRAVVTIDNKPVIRMDYFLKQARLMGTQPIDVLQALTYEQLLKQVAPQYVGTVSTEEINQELRRGIFEQSENATESEFKEWYRQQLNESGLSDAEYKEIIRANILATRLQKYLAERMPTVAEQVHLNGIVLETSQEAEKIRARWQAGEKFADLAREASRDEEFKQNGGDLGWFPRGVSNFIDNVAFNLDIGEISEVIPYYFGESSPPQQVYYLLLVSEKAVAREVDKDKLEVLQAKTLENWLAEEIQSHKIEYHGLTNGFDSATSSWINWQLAKKVGK